MRYEGNVFREGIKMLSESNIVEIIKVDEKEMAEIKIELMKTDSDIVKRALKDKLNFLEDNCYRYKLQAKAWGIEV
ncbi:Uncharacterised protein [uncultured Clostridium sp.]